VTDTDTVAPESLVAAATDGLAVTTGAFLDVTEVMVDSSRWYGAVLAGFRGVHAPEAPLVTPAQRLVQLTADGEWISAAAHSLQHLALANGTDGHRRTP
jgi:hypothetical protein